MKKIISSLILTAVWLLASAFVKLGDPAPELAKGHWLRGAPVKISDQKNKKMTVLFFWEPTSGSARSIQTLARLQSSLKSRGVVVIAIGKASGKKLLDFPMTQQLSAHLMADVAGNNMKLFLRPESRLPMAVLIDRQGRLLWRGPVSSLSRVIAQVQRNIFNLERARKADDFSAAFSGFMKKSDFKGALALLERELNSKSGNPKELVSLQVGIHYRRLNSVSGALQAVHKAQQRFPGNSSFYEMELRLLDMAGLESNKSEFYYRLTRIFSQKVPVLLNFLRFEMERPCSSMRPDNIYTIARAAAHAPKYKDKKEQGKALIYYAQALYCCGRPDLALKAAEKALPLLKGSKQYDEAAGVCSFYKKLVQLAPHIK